jgi:hypothetical protein
MITTVTNIPGTNSSDARTVINSALSFTLSGTPSIPGKYYIRGWINVTCTNNAAGAQVLLYRIGSDTWAGYFERGGGSGADQNVSLAYWGVPFYETMNAVGKLSQIYATTTNTSARFEAYVTTVQTNRYDWQLFQVSTLAADTPVLTTNSWIRIEKFQ